MAATTTRKVAPKQRTVRLQSADTTTPLMLVHVGDDAFGYGLERIASDFGTAFRLTKYECGKEGPQGEYDVLIDGLRSSCTCKGFTYRGHCKHVDALTKLRQLGKL